MFAKKEKVIRDIKFALIDIIPVSPQGFTRGFKFQ